MSPTSYLAAPPRVRSVGAGFYDAGPRRSSGFSQCVRSLARFSTITHMPASMRRFLSAVPLLGLLWLAIASSCNCGSHKASGTARCDIDLSPFRGAGVGAVARVITSTAERGEIDVAARSPAGLV